VVTRTCRTCTPAADISDAASRRLRGLLAARLFADGICAVDVPAKLATRVRMLSTGHGRKNDAADAISVAVTALTAGGLRSVAIDEAIIVLRALVEHRDDVVKTRTQTVNRLDVLLTQLLPAGAPRQLGADAAAALLRTVRPRSTGPRTLRRLAAELIAEVRHLDRRIAVATTDITAAVTTPCQSRWVVPWRWECAAVLGGVQASPGQDASGVASGVPGWRCCSSTRATWRAGS